MDSEEFKELVQLIQDGVHPESPEERKSRFDFYLKLGGLIVAGITVVAVWGLASQWTATTSPNIPHCIFGSNIAPICK